MRTVPAERWRGIATSTDWTDACIAVDTDADIDAIAAWMLRTRVTRVVLE